MAEGRFAAPAADNRLPAIALLTGGGDRPYVLGIAESLTAAGIPLDVIGSDFLDCRELRSNSLVRFLNFRGDMSLDAPLPRKIVRIVRYYARLVRYAITAEPTVLHVLWNGKLEYMERTFLPIFFRMCGKRVVRTVHNVNAGKRDGRDGALNRLTLRFQYRLSDHLFVHTERMKEELAADFGVRPDKISVIPFGINSSVPDSGMTSAQSRERLGLGSSAKVVLFYGNIAPYKGLEYLVRAFAAVVEAVPDCHLVIAGRPKGSERYWEEINREIDQLGLTAQVTRRIEYVPDEETEIYFKAADLLALPYLHVFQSGVLFLGYNFGLPVIASDVASLKEDIVEGRTGYVCQPADPVAISDAIVRFFGSSLYRDLEQSRDDIRCFACEKYSWNRVSEITVAVYKAQLANPDEVSPA